MFIAELNHPMFSMFDLTSLRTGIMAGSLCPVELMKQVEEKMFMACNQCIRVDGSIARHDTFAASTIRRKSATIRWDVTTNSPKSA